MNIVATVLTVYGIETIFPNEEIFKERVTLQQYLPFTVLKQRRSSHEFCFVAVATVLTVYGIET